MGWVSQLSSSGYVFRVLLIEAGINPNGFFGEEIFLEGHLAVCEAVANGDVDVGATFTDDIFEKKTPKRVSACAKMGVFADDTFKVLSATKEVPSDVIAARVGLGHGMIKSVGTALDGLTNVKDLRAKLGRSLDADGFIEVGLADYSEVERNLEILESE